MIDGNSFDLLYKTTVIVLFISLPMAIWTLTSLIDIEFDYARKVGGKKARECLKELE